MPSNIVSLKRDLKQFIEGRGPVAKSKGSPIAVARKVLAFTLLKNLAKTTPIDIGELNGGWLLSVGGIRTRSAPTTARVVSNDNASRISKITATNRVSINNNVEHAGYVEFGTRNMAPRAFTQLALQATQLELRAQGIIINYNISSGL